MVAFRFLFIFVVIFLCAEHSLAFDTIIEGKEYMFKYHLEARSYVKRGIKTTSDHQFFRGDLTIKALPGNLLECQMTEVVGKGVDYLDELKQKFTVKLNGGNVLEVNNTGKGTVDGNHKKSEMIEQIMKDRSDIVRLIKEGHSDITAQIDMPIGGKCLSHLNEETKKDLKFYKARSYAPNCVIKKEVLAQLQSMGFGDPSEDSPTEVALIYETVSNKQIGLRLYVGIRMWNSNSNIVLSNQKVEIEFLGSEDITPK